MFFKIDLLRNLQYSQENAFFYEYCKTFTNSFFYRTPPVDALVSLMKSLFSNAADLLFLIKNIMWYGFY